MKRIKLLSIVALTLLVGYSFKTISELKKTSADVKSYGGIAVFMDCTPVNEYDVIGEVKLARISYNGDNYDEARNTLIKKCKETYPTGEALLMENVPFTSKYSAKVITFKK